MKSQKLSSGKTSKQLAGEALKKLLENKKVMDDLAQMTGIMWKLNDREREALMRYQSMIESNARRDMLTRLFNELIKVMHEEELRQFQKNIMKQYGFWKVR